jgi:exodeoxyribonuclease VII large subunit
MVSFSSREPLFDKPAFSVTELNLRIKEVLEGHIGTITVNGEISEWKRYPSSGHCYFTLKDDRCQLKCVLWKSSAAKLQFEPEVGMEVLVTGRVSVYEVRGDLQLYADRIEPKGMGILQLKFEQLKKKLAAEGLFDDSRKRAIPMLPRKIGIVTSLAGAVRHDMINTILKRHPRPHVVLVDVRVQGDGAAEEIAAGLKFLTANVVDLDVVIVGRGGGSIEDLWAFNEEPVVRAIVASPVPVISAVGHETDFTLADFAADRRAKTPTDAATIVIPILDELTDRLDKMVDKLQSRLRDHVNQAGLTIDRYRESFAMRSIEKIVPQNRDRLSQLGDRIRLGLATAVASRKERLASLAQNRLLREPKEIVRQFRIHLDQLSLHRAWGRLGASVEQHRLSLASSAKFMSTHMSNRLATLRESFRSLDQRLQGLSPLAVLERGYSITRVNGKIVLDASTVKPGSKMLTRLHKGEIQSTTE